MKKQTQTKKRQNRSRSRSKKVTRSKKYNKKSIKVGGHGGLEDGHSYEITSENPIYTYPNHIYTLINKVIDTYYFMDFDSRGPLQEIRLTEAEMVANKIRFKEVVRPQRIHEAHPENSNFGEN